MCLSYFNSYADNFLLRLKKKESTHNESGAGRSTIYSVYSKCIFDA